MLGPVLFLVFINGLALIWVEKKKLSQCNHLGIFRDIKQKVNIEEKISLGRKKAYTLLGVGLHSGNGQKKLYVLTYGLHM